MISDLPERLGERLKTPLPGPRVQHLWQPELAYGRHFGPPPASARSAAVLILLYVSDGCWTVPLTVRPETLLNHPRQISLPGGLVERDERTDEAALREFGEELGVACDAITLLGQLSPIYVFATDYTVVPWLAATHLAVEFNPSPEEVAELLPMPVDVLLDPNTRSSTPQHARGVEIMAPCLRLGRHCIWGATCMILAEFASLLHDVTLADHGN